MNERPGNDSKLDKNAKNKKEKLAIYRKIDEKYSTNERPKNPAEFIDKKTMKETINPGIPYLSTSQNAVFERRIILRQKEYLNKKNKFIAAPEDDNKISRYEGVAEESFINCNFSPYQLKTYYEHLDVQELEWSSDDEDAQILQ